MLNAFCKVTFATLAVASLVARQQSTPTNLGADANGNPRRLALKTGHVSNYDESKMTPYALPDPLVLANGKPVRDARTWTKERRPELIRVYEAEIFGRIPRR